MKRLATALGYAFGVAMMLTGIVTASASADDAPPVQQEQRHPGWDARPGWDAQPGWDIKGWD